jgi:hypothetical protein
MVIFRLERLATGSGWPEEIAEIDSLCEQGRFFGMRSAGITPADQPT